jgi:hypothetical protein
MRHLSSHAHKHITKSESFHLPPPKRRDAKIGDCRRFQFTLFPLGMMTSITPSMRGYINVTVRGGPVGVPLPIGGTSAILGLSMTGLHPHSLVKRRGGEKEFPGVTARSRLSIVAGGRRQRIQQNRRLRRLCCRWPFRGGGGLPMGFWEGSPEGEPGDRQAHSHGHQRGSPPLFSEAEGGWRGSRKLVPFK